MWGFELLFLSVGGHLVFSWHSHQALQDRGRGAPARGSCCLVAQLHSRCGCAAAVGRQQQAHSSKRSLLACISKHASEVLLWVWEKPVQGCESCFPAFPFPSGMAHAVLCGFALCTLGSIFFDLQECFAQFTFQCQWCI